MSVTQVPSADRSELWPTLEDATSVLLLAAEAAEPDGLCRSVLEFGAPDDANFLGVAVGGVPDSRFEQWQQAMGELPTGSGVITVGEPTRSAAASVPGPGPSPLTIDSVADPSDLTGLAMAIGAYLDAWADSARPAVVCFSSVGTLLLHADRERVFRFLHSTTCRLRDIGAVAHCHVDPGPLEESEVNALSGLFDAVVRFEDDGTVTVHRRR